MEPAPVAHAPFCHPAPRLISAGFRFLISSESRMDETSPLGRSAARPQKMNAEQGVIVGPCRVRRPSRTMSQLPEFFDRVLVRVLGMDGFVLVEPKGDAGDQCRLGAATLQMHFDAAEVLIVEGHVR